MGRRLDERGFSLLELMISLTLLVVMLATTYSVFATALDAVPRGEATAERSARLRAATSLLARQVRSVVNYPAVTESEYYPYFWGNPSSFGFITAAPQHNGGEGLGWVTYWSDGRSFSMAERVIFSPSSIGGDQPEAESQVTLLDGLAGARFQYLRLDGTESEWIDSWDGLTEQTLPAAIRVTLEGIGVGDTYWVQEIPVMTVVYGLGAYDSDIGLDADLNELDREPEDGD